jgi:hypothetical protein
MTCMSFTSPARLDPETPFRLTLFRDYELRVHGTIAVGPRSAPEDDYLWIVSPPLQTAPHRFIYPSYGLSPDASARIDRSFHFVLGQPDYDKVLALYRAGTPAAEYLDLLAHLRLGTLSIVITDYAARGNEFEWVEFRGEACIPSP